MNIIGIVLLINLSIFIVMMLYARRGLHVGTWFMITSITFLGFLSNIVGNNPDTWQYKLLYLFGLGILSTLVIIPFTLLVTFFYSAIMLIKKEGASFKNMLSLGCGIVLIAYMFIWPIMNSIFDKHNFFNYLYVYVSLLILYMIVISIVFTISSLLNAIHVLPITLDYIIVLGAGLNGKKVTPLLATRIDKAIKLYKKSPTSRLIMSGGQGADEIISEAEAMYHYAIEQGVPKEDILLETQSKNTEENLKFSYQLIHNKTKKIAIVTNYYHLFRALIIARKQKIRCIGYGAKTKFYFSVNAFIREFIGYLVLTKKWHIIVLSLCTILYIFSILVGLAYDIGLL